jgi:hypothetical protein
MPRPRLSGGLRAGRPRLGLVGRRQLVGRANFLPLFDLMSVSEEGSDESPRSVWSQPQTRSVIERASALERPHVLQDARNHLGCRAVHSRRSSQRSVRAGLLTDTSSLRDPIPDSSASRALLRAAMVDLELGGPLRSVVPSRLDTAHLPRSPGERHPWRDPHVDLT